MENIACENLKAYGQVRSVRSADMDLLVGETQRIGIFTVADFSAFYRKFSTITEYLLSLEHIGNRDISTD